MTTAPREAGAKFKAASRLPITRSGLGTRRQFGALLDRKPDYLEILPMVGDRISKTLWTFPGTNA